MVLVTLKGAAEILPGGTMQLEGPGTPSWAVSGLLPLATPAKERPQPAPTHAPAQKGPAFRNTWQRMRVLPRKQLLLCTARPRSWGEKRASTSGELRGRLASWAVRTWGPPRRLQPAPSCTDQAATALGSGGRPRPRGRAGGQCGGPAPVCGGNLPLIYVGAWPPPLFFIPIEKN